MKSEIASESIMFSSERQIKQDAFFRLFLSTNKKLLDKKPVDPYNRFTMLKRKVTAT